MRTTGRKIAMGIAVSGTMAVSACKVRDPNAAGLLDSPHDEIEPTEVNLTETVADGGRFSIDCRALEGSGHYLFEVRGALRDDEAQPLSVGVERRDGEKPQVLAKDEAARGRVMASGSLFVGFASGALTGEPSSEGEGTHLGVLSLANIPDAQAAAVRCRVAALQ